jgi:uncharacterized protein (TIGR02996 family)
MADTVVDPVERSFLEDIMDALDPDPVWLIYADWLTDRGDPRGEYLRLRVRLKTLSGAERVAAQERLDQLRREINPIWAQIYGQIYPTHRVLNCGKEVEALPVVRFTFRCPQKWLSLQPTDDASVRFCQTCQKDVHFCDTAEAVERHAVRGDCVAIPPRLAGQIDKEKGGPTEEDYENIMGRPSSPSVEALQNWGQEIFGPKPSAPVKRWWEFWKWGRSTK